MVVALCETENKLRDMDKMKDVFAGQISICKEHGGKETGIGFGEYLVYEGKIDAYELESAIHYQNVEHVVLGVLALQEEHLNERQLCDVLDYQRERGGLFGEIAIELGFINEDGVDALLKKQGEKHIRIGEVL
ncbi:MAG: hypothetical protein H8D23_35565, partial [Candidatus Brocadiales bacterium]|nr:hypothetical protein [Candidatus Brocadiales bacterium]